MLDPLLHNLWQRIQHPGTGNDTAWNEEIETLFRYGIGMEETLRFLYSEKPEIEEFEKWVLSKTIKEKDGSIVLPENTLSQDDLEFFNEQGFVVIRNAIPHEDCENTRNVIWDFLKMNPLEPGTWYKPHAELRGLMLTFTNHPALHKNRESPKIKKAFEQLYNSERIYKSIDKVSFNPPETASFKFAGDNLHWDMSLKSPIPFCLQGLLYLTDCNVEDGSFHCVPGFHNKIQNWINGLAPGVNPRAVAPDTLTPIPVTGKAGDFIIWHQALPHCATPNRGTQPRIVQYLTYKPMGYTEPEIWI